MLSLLLIFIAIIFSRANAMDPELIPGMEKTGTKWVLMKSGIEEFINVLVLPKVENAINGFAIPAFSGTVKTSIGKVEYSVSDMSMMNFDFKDASFDLNSLENTIEFYTSLSGTLKMSYSYTMLSFPYTSDEGIATIFVNETKLSGIASPKRSDDIRFTVTLIDANVDITDFDISIESDKAWLYEMLLSIFKDQIITSISKSLTDILGNVIDDVFRRVGVGKTTYDSHIGAIVDIATTNELGFTVFDDWLTIEMSWYSAPYVENYDPYDRQIFASITDVEDFMNVYNSKTFQIIAPKQRVAEFIRVLYSTGVFSETFSKDGVHDDYFAPSFWDGVLDISSNYNDVTSWSYRIDFADDFLMEFLIGAVRVKTDLFISLLDQNGTERIDMKLSVTLASQPRINEQTLSLTQDLVEINDIEIISGDAKVIGTDYESIEKMIEELFFSHVNDILGRGGLPCKDTANTGSIYHEGDESFVIVPDSEDSDGLLVYSMNPIVIA